MATYVLRRLILIIPTLIGMTIVTFTIMAISPGGISPMVFNDTTGLDPKLRKAIENYVKQRYGLDQPYPVQYLRWLNNISPVGFEVDSEGKLGSFGVKAPDLGRSFMRDEPVSALIGRALPITLTLNLITIPIIYALSITLGIYSAKHHGKTLDVVTGTSLIALWSVPTIVTGVMLVGLLASNDYLRWFPTNGLHDVQSSGSMPFFPSYGPDGWERGWLLDSLWHLVLPTICLSYTGFAYLTKLTRSAVLENLSSDFVRTARAKGVGPRHVLFRHVFRNSLIPLITVAAHILPGLLAGSIIVEYIFGIDGMGKLFIEAIRGRDREVVLSIACIGGMLGLLSYLIADVGYAIADPRVSYE